MPSKREVKFRAQQRPRQQQLIQQQQREQQAGDGGEGADNLNRTEFTNIMGQVVDVLGRLEHSIQRPQRGELRDPTPTPKPTPKPAAQPSAEDAVNALLSGNVEPLRALMQGQQMDPNEFNDMKGKLNQLVQVVSMQAAESIPQNEAYFRAQVDARWGEGAYDQYLKGAIDEKFKEQPGMRANRSYFSNMVNLVTGEHVDDLSKHKSDADEKAATAREEEQKLQQQQYPFMLGGGVPISMRDGRVNFDGKDEEWIRRYEAENGTHFDREKSAKMVGALMQSSTGKSMVTASIDDLEKAFPQQSTGGDS